MKSIDLGTEKVRKIFLRFAIPSILVMVTQTVAYIVDSIFIGRFIGPNGLSAITLFFPLVSFFIGIASMIAVGSNNMAGISMGEGDFSKSNHYFNIAIRSIVILSIGLSFFVLLNMRNLTLLLNIDGEPAQFVVQYGMTISSFFIVYMLNLVLSYFIKLEGKPEWLIKVALVSVLANVMLDYFFIVYLQWALVGAALATGLSQVVMLGFMLYHFFKVSSWRLKRTPYSFITLRGICFNGFSQFLTELSMSITGFLLNIIILKYYGLLGIAGYAVATQCRSMVGSIGNGVSEAGRVGVSFNHGAKKDDRVVAFRRLTSLSALVIGGLFFVLMKVFGHSIARLFVNDLATIEMATTILQYLSISFALIGFNISIRTYFAAINAPKIATLYTLYRSILSVIIGLAIFPTLYGSVGIWYALIFKEMSSTLIGVVLYYRGVGTLKANERSKLEKIS